MNNVSLSMNTVEFSFLPINIDNCTYSRLRRKKFLCHWFWNQLLHYSNFVFWNDALKNESYGANHLNTMQLRIWARSTCTHMHTSSLPLPSLSLIHIVSHTQPLFPLYWVASLRLCFLSKGLIRKVKNLFKIVRYLVYIY